VKKSDRIEKGITQAGQSLGVCFRWRFADFEMIPQFAVSGRSKSEKHKSSLSSIYESLTQYIDRKWMKFRSCIC
jgi:hypothetical protein